VIPDSEKDVLNDARGPFEDKKRSGTIVGGNGIFSYPKSWEVRNEVCSVCENAKSDDVVL
jgi:hypothetical protein